MKTKDHILAWLLIILCGIIGYCLGHYVIGPLIWDINY